MTFDEWASRWHIPAAAIDELCLSVVYVPDVTVDKPIKSEGRVQSEVRLEAVSEDVYLFRNNVGAGSVLDEKKLCVDCARQKRSFTRWGLGNDSPQINKRLKSADLIGIRKRLITSQDVGRHIGQFISREVKKSEWEFSGTEDEQAQVRWATLINAQGGDAQIVTSVGSLKTLNTGIGK